MRLPRIHPVDLLVLVLAGVLAVAAYSFLFRNTPVPRPVDNLLGVVITVEHTPKHEWQRRFPEEGPGVRIEEYLSADVIGGPEPSPTDPAAVRLRLRIHDRDDQRPEGLTLFTSGIRRGSMIRLSNRKSQVVAEVVAVELRPEAK